MSGESRTYEIETAQGAYRIEVPAGTRVSYGPVIGAAGKSSYGGNVLRFWSGSKGSATEVQLALFGDVTSFRDLSLPLLRRAVRKFGSEEWLSDDGSWTGKKSEQVERSWKPVDDLAEPVPEVQPDDEFVPLSRRTAKREF